MTLFELTQNAKDLYDLLTSADVDEEEREQIIADTMESIGAEEKLESYAAIINQLTADEQMLKAEEERLAKKRKSVSANKDRMKAAVMAYMDAKGSVKENAGTFTISFRKSQAVNIIDEALISGDYLVTETVTKVDKMAIKNAIKNGTTVEGAEIVENRSVVIK